MTKLLRAAELKELGILQAEVRHRRYAHIQKQTVERVLKVLQRRALDICMEAVEDEDINGGPAGD